MFQPFEIPDEYERGRCERCKQTEVKVYLIRTESASEYLCDKCINTAIAYLMEVKKIIKDSSK